MNPGCLLPEFVPLNGYALPPCFINSGESIFSCLNPLENMCYVPTRFQFLSHSFLGEKQLEIPHWVWAGGVVTGSCPFFFYKDL